MGERLFLMYVVLVEEDQWFAPETDDTLIRVERRHSIVTQLFAANDAKAAYRTATEWLPGFSDSNHDGLGDLTRTYAIGLHELEELSERLSELPAALQDMYGVEVSRYDPSLIALDGVPRVRAKQELEVFRPSGTGRRQ